MEISIPNEEHNTIYKTYKIMPRSQVFILNILYLGQFISVYNNIPANKTLNLKIISHIWQSNFFKHTYFLFRLKAFKVNKNKIMISFLQQRFFEHTVYSTNNCFGVLGE